MTTAELIDKAKTVSMLNRNNGRDLTADIIDLLALRLEMAHNDLLQGCGTCAYYGEKVDDRCKNCHQAHQYAEPTEWLWRGDKE